MHGHFMESKYIYIIHFTVINAKFFNFWQICCFIPEINYCKIRTLA